MFLIHGLSYHDIAALKGHEHLMPGAPEPAWLRRSIDNARVLAEIRADKRAAREQSPTGIVRKLRLVFSRG